MFVIKRLVITLMFCDRLHAWLVKIGVINISISPLRLHSASSVQIPSSTRKCNIMLPSIKIRPLNILSASSVNLFGITNCSVFHNNLRIRMSPLKSLILRKYTNPFKRCEMYPSISKCNAKRCKCCKR